MMNIEKTVNEFCKEGNLENYRDVLFQLFYEIENSGCSISAKYNDELSLHEKSPSSCRVRISFIKKYPEPIHIIWIILHEFGHHFDPLKKEDEHNMEIRVQHEEKAWDWGHKKMLAIKELKEKEDNFMDCRKNYMDAYYKHLRKYYQLTGKK